ncbi:MAG TPA: ABC transporter permease [Nocardioidaceae bacterium]|nr:ABC transporter permease [Nocardioidaceae bacterium]
MDGLPFLEYVQEYQSDFIFETERHAILTLYVVVTAAILGTLIAMLTYRSSAGSQFGISAAAVGFTIPSLALFGLLVPVLGFGLNTIFPALVMYSLLPTIRNGVVGLRSVDPVMIDAARGMGMSRRHILLRIELPLAWPVILAGIRVSTQLAVGLVAIAAFLSGPGLGTFIFHALTAIGSVNTFNEAVAATILVALLAIVFDFLLLIVRRLTTPRGLRA